MRKLFIALVAAVTIAGSLVVAPGEADARYWRGGAVAAGVVGGLAAGAIIAGAAAPYYYAPPPPPPPYYAPAPVYYGPACRWVKQRWWDGYGWRVRRVQVC
jgi:hypothetical protein